MNVLSINLKPSSSDDAQVIEGHVTVDQMPIISTPIKIELEVLPLGPPAAIRGSVCNYYSFRVELKTSKISDISIFSKSDEPIKIPIEELHRFSGFLDH